MFGALWDDRHSLLLVAGVALAAAYLAGGAAVANGLEDALSAQAGRFDEGPRVAFSGSGILQSEAYPEPPPDAAAHLLLIHATDAEGASWLVACVASAGAGLDAGDVGLGRAIRAPAVEFAGGRVIEGRVESPSFPRGWVLAPCALVEDLAQGPPSRVLLLPDGATAPADATVVPLAALQSFVVSGAGAVLAVLVLLVVATSVVAILLSSTLTAAALEAHARDVHLLRSIGATRRALVGVATRWLARVVGAGVVAGAALGVVAAYAAFSFGNRAGIRAPIVPAPDPLVLGASLAVLAAAAVLAGIVAASRVVDRLEGARLEATQ